jgi:hypothetical protein
MQGTMWQGITTWAAQVGRTSYQPNRTSAEEASLFRFPSQPSSSPRHPKLHTTIAADRREWRDPSVGKVTIAIVCLVSGKSWARATRAIHEKRNRTDMHRKLVHFARALPFQVQTKPKKAMRDRRTRWADRRMNHALDVRRSDKNIASFIIR